MHIVVCVKQILDPEVPSQKFNIDREAKKPVAGDIPLVTSVFDENALEVAIQLKGKIPGAKITAVTVGPKKADESLRKAMAMTVDEAARVDSGTVGDLDSFATSLLLAAAIQKLGHCDLILCGRQAGDWDNGQVGSLLAERLGAGCVTFVTSIEPEGAELRFKQDIEGGYAIIAGAPPVVATITNADTNVPRLPKIKDIMAANRKPITVWSPVDLQVDAEQLAGNSQRTYLADLFIPVRESTCEMIEGEDGGEKAAGLLKKLAEMKVV